MLNAMPPIRNYDLWHDGAVSGAQAYQAFGTALDNSNSEGGV